MAYTPNPVDSTQPVDSVLASTAAAEFRALKAYIQTIVSGGGPGAQFPGQVAAFPGLIAPPGWLLCDNTLRLRSDFPVLWAAANALGAVAFENDYVNNGYWSWFSDGNGTTTFRCPDLRGVFVRGADLGRGLDVNARVGLFQADANQSHSHGLSVGSAVIAFVGAGGNLNGAVGSNLLGANIQNQGAGEAVPKNVSLRYYIKT